MSPKIAKHHPKKRGRPPLSPDGESPPFSVRLDAARLAELRRLVAAGHGPTPSDALRHLIDASITARRKGR